MMVNPEDSCPVNYKGINNRRRKRTLGKLFSAFSRGRKSPSSFSSSFNVVDVQRMSPMSPSPQPDVSSVSSSCSEHLNLPNSRMTLAASSAELTSGNKNISTELSEKSTQTTALSSGPNAVPYGRNELPDTTYSYSKHNSCYPTKHLSKYEVERRHPTDVTATAAAANWRRTVCRHPVNPTSQRHRKRSSANEMDILSFFDTGSVDHGYTYKCNSDDGVVASDMLYPVRDSHKGTDRQLLSSESKSRQRLMLENKDIRCLDHQHPSQRHNCRNDVPIGDEFEDTCMGNVEKRVRPAQFHLQTVKNNQQCPGGPTSFWYCEKMDKNKLKKIPDANECEPTSCCGSIVDPTKLSQKYAERLQQTAAARSGSGTPYARQISNEENRNRPFTNEEKRRLAKIGAIILATAGVAALFILLVKYRRQSQACKAMMGDEDDVKSSDNDEDDNGVCIFEKLDRVKCQNNNFKAMMSNTEKLIEHEDKVCASQDFRKVTKRLKDQSDAKTKDIFCSCTDKECNNINKKKCFDNF